jgi:hypothetical protein
LGTVACPVQSRPVAEPGECRNVIEELLRIAGADAVVENGIFIEANSSDSIYEFPNSTAQRLMLDSRMDAGRSFVVTSGPVRPF